MTEEELGRRQRIVASVAGLAAIGMVVIPFAVAHSVVESWTPAFYTDLPEPVFVALSTWAPMGCGLLSLQALAGALFAHSLSARRRRQLLAASVALPVMALGMMIVALSCQTGWWIDRAEQVLPEVDRLAGDHPWAGVYRRSFHHEPTGSGVQQLTIAPSGFLYRSEFRSNSCLSRGVVTTSYNAGYVREAEGRLLLESTLPMRCLRAGEYLHPVYYPIQRDGVRYLVPEEDLQYFCRGLMSTGSLAGYGYRDTAAPRPRADTPTQLPADWRAFCDKEPVETTISEVLIPWHRDWGALELTGEQRYTAQVRLAAGADDGLLPGLTLYFLGREPGCACRDLLHRAFVRVLRVDERTADAEVVWPNRNDPRTLWEPGRLVRIVRPVPLSRQVELLDCRLSNRKD